MKKMKKRYYPLFFYTFVHLKRRFSESFLLLTILKKDLEFNTYIIKNELNFTI